MWHWDSNTDRGARGCVEDDKGQATTKVPWRIWVTPTLLRTVAWSAPVATPALHCQGAEGMLAGTRVPGRRQTLTSLSAVMWPRRAVRDTCADRSDEWRLRASDCSPGQRP